MEHPYSRYFNHTYTTSLPANVTSTNLNLLASAHLPTFPLPSPSNQNRHAQAHEAKSARHARQPNEPTRPRLPLTTLSTPPSNLPSCWGIVSETSDFRDHRPQNLTRALHYRLAIEMAMITYLPLTPITPLNIRGERARENERACDTVNSRRRNFALSATPVHKVSHRYGIFELPHEAVFTRGVCSFENLNNHPRTTYLPLHIPEACSVVLVTSSPLNYSTKADRSASATARSTSVSAL